MSLHIIEIPYKKCYTCNRKISRANVNTALSSMRIAILNELDLIPDLSRTYTTITIRWEDLLNLKYSSKQDFHKKLLKIIANMGTKRGVQNGI